MTMIFIIISIFIRITLMQIGRDTGLIILFGCLLFPIHSAIVIRIISRKNKGISAILLILGMILGLYEWDIMSDFAIREFISIAFFSGTNMTKDPGAHSIVAIFSFISTILLLLFYMLSKKLIRIESFE